MVLSWLDVAVIALVASMAGVAIGWVLFGRGKVTPEDVDRLISTVALVLRAAGGTLSDETWQAIARAVWDGSAFLQEHYEREAWAALILGYIRQAGQDAQELHLEALAAHYEAKPQKRLDTTFLM